MEDGLQLDILSSEQLLSHKYTLRHESIRSQLQLQLQYGEIARRKNYGSGSASLVKATLNAPEHRLRKRLVARTLRESHHNQLACCSGMSWGLLNLLI